MSLRGVRDWNAEPDPEAEGVVAEMQALAADGELTRRLQRAPAAERPSEFVCPACHNRCTATKTRGGVGHDPDCSRRGWAPERGGGGERDGQATLAEAMERSPSPP